MGTELATILEKYWHEFLEILPKIILAVIILIIFFLIGGRSSKLIRKKLSLKLNDILLSHFISRIVKWSLMIIGFIIAMEILGLVALAGGLIAGAGVTAIILGLAFKDIGENFLSGVILAFNRPFKIGDLILIEGITGTITSMDFRTTNIKTAEGHDVFIPNSIIINNPLTNFTYDNLRRFDFTIQIDYSNDIAKAKLLILDSIHKVKGVLKEPAPIVVVDELTSSVSLRIIFWIDCNDLQRTVLEIKSDVIELSKKELSDGGLGITDLTQIKITNESIPIKINS